jgi:hypothetical protein
MGNILSSTAGATCTLFDIVNFSFTQPLISVPSAAGGAYVGYFYIDKSLLVVGICASGGLVVGYFVLGNKDPNCKNGLAGLITSLFEQAFGLAKGLAQGAGAVVKGVGGGVADLVNTIKGQDPGSAAYVACKEAISSAYKQGKITKDQMEQYMLSNTGIVKSSVPSCQQDIKNQVTEAYRRQYAAQQAIDQQYLSDAANLGLQYRVNPGSAPPPKSRRDEVEAQVLNILASGARNGIVQYQIGSGNKVGGMVPSVECAINTSVLGEATALNVPHLGEFQLYYARRCLGYMGTSANFNPNILPTRVT